MRWLENLTLLWRRRDESRTLYISLKCYPDPSQPSHHIKQAPSCNSTELLREREFGQIAHRACIEPRPKGTKLAVSGIVRFDLSEQWSSNGSVVLHAFWKWQAADTPLRCTSCLQMSAVLICFGFNPLLRKVESSAISGVNLLKVAGWRVLWLAEKSSMACSRACHGGHTGLLHLAEARTMMCLNPFLSLFPFEPAFGRNFTPWYYSLDLIFRSIAKIASSPSSLWW